MQRLPAIIHQKIQEFGGRITFADFMSLALYHPTLGYYNRPSMTIGENGDFYTSPMVHEIFGQCMARQIYYCWQGLGSPARFVIVEMGAGTGALARDVLVEWDRLHTEAGSREAVTAEYYIVEQSPILQSTQQQTTAEIANGRITWQQTLAELPGYGSLTGVVLTNELFDALPVHRLIFEGGQLQERYVTAAAASDRVDFSEVSGELSDAKLAGLLPESVLQQLADGERVEVSAIAGEVLQSMADALQAGFILTVDYGDEAPAVYWQSANTGGIRCYYKRALNRDPYIRVGEQDITADVDFSFLQLKGQQAGLQTVAFSTQSEFLERLGFLDKIQALQRLAFIDLRADFELQRMLSLYLPDGLGTACKVLIQAKIPGSMREVSEPRGEMGER